MTTLWGKVTYMLKEVSWCALETNKIGANTQSLAMTKVYQIVPTALHTVNTSTHGTGNNTKCVAHIQSP